MIHELADIRVVPGREADFEAALQRGIETVIARAAGFLGYELRRGVETPGRYLLMIRWRTLEDHTVGFREGALFGEWRSIVGPYFAAPR